MLFTGGQDRGQGARILGMKGKRYKLLWSGKGDEVGGVGGMLKRICVKR